VLVFTVHLPVVDAPTVTQDLCGPCVKEYRADGYGLTLY
jgi:hypothetical protein